MDEESTGKLKRSNDQTNNRDGPPSKRRNTGNLLDFRRTRNKINVYANPAGGTVTDPLNLNNAMPNKLINSANERKRRFDDASSSNYHRRVSFRQSKKRADNLPSITEEPSSSVEARKAKQAKLKQRYRYGNFNYHHRTNAPFQNDPRLDLLVSDWFNGNVLDLGCNAGLLTLSIARAFSPRRILGIDIDSHLIAAARKNIRHFEDKDQKMIGRFPASFALNFGPISVLAPATSSNFPDNVWFRQENYVLANDEELNNVKEEFDIIIAFSFTKWIHLNFGDDGLKRVFKRVYRQLKPGGRFVFEPQSSRGYRNRAKMMPEMEQIYKSIKFWPEHFIPYLLSIGFCHYEALDTPLVRSLNCDAPIFMLYKGPMMGWQNAPCSPVQNISISEADDTPLNHSCTPRTDDSQCASTPRDEPSSVPTTPDFS